LFAAAAFSEGAARRTLSAIRLKECNQAKLGEQAATRRCLMAEVRAAFLQTRRCRRQLAAPPSAARRALPRRCSVLSRPQDELAATSKAVNELRAQLAALQAAHAALQAAHAEALAQLRSKCAGDLEGKLIELQTGLDQAAYYPIPGDVCVPTGELRMSRRRRRDAAAASPQGQASALPAAPEPLTLLNLPNPLLLQIMEVHSEACFDCTGINRRLRRVSLEAVGALAAQRWAVRLAAERGHVAALRALLDGGADTEAEFGRYQMRALHVAALNGRAAAARLLLERGADVKAVDRDRYTALHCGASSGCAEVAQLLLDAGSDVNSAGCLGQSALHHAAELGHTAVAQLLLNAGGRMDAVDWDQRSALHLAASKSHTSVVELLVARGADVHLRETLGSTALWEAADHGHTATVRVLLAAGADVHAAGLDGLTPLAAARDGSYADTVQALMEAGATH
jgi:ankyrin repeat protein